MSNTSLRILSLTIALFTATGAFAQSDPNQKSTPAELVDALNGVFVKQTDNRAVHAKGIVLEGKFTPSADAASLSKAPHLQAMAVPITVRFSDFAGSDTDGLASPRGMAVKFHLPGGSDFRPRDALVQRLPDRDCRRVSAAADRTRCEWP